MLAWKSNGASAASKRIEAKENQQQKNGVSAYGARKDLGGMGGVDGGIWAKNISGMAWAVVDESGDAHVPAKSISASRKHRFCAP